MNTPKNTAVFLLSLALWAVAPTRADAFEEFLDFNNNQLPVGWTLGFPNGPGTNASVTNGRFEARQVDTYAEISKPIQLALGTSELNISYTGNIADVYWGMGSQIHLYEPGGYTSTFIGKAGYGTQAMRLGVGYENGSSFAFALDQSPAPNYGNYNVNASFRDQQVTYSVTKAGEATPLYQGTVSVPQLQLSDINRIGLFALTTTGSPAWIDDVHISTVVTQPPPRLFGLAVGQNAGFNLRGDKGANKVFDKLSQSSAWLQNGTAGNSTAPLIFTNNFTQNLGNQVTSSLNSMDVRAGDTVVFYYNGHGGPLSSGDGGETSITLNNISDSRDEFFASDLSDDSLYQLFSQPKWTGVRKIFLLDSCHSGGFLGTAGVGDIGDLEKLSNFALFASATEATDAYPEDSLLSFALGEFGNYGMGVWTARGLLPALDVESLTTASLQSLIDSNLGAAISEYSSSSHFAFDINDPASRSFAGFNTNTVISSDFDTSGTVLPVPEPCSILLLGSGAIALFLRRRNTNGRNA